MAVLTDFFPSKQICQSQPSSSQHILFSAFLKGRRTSLQQLLTQLSPYPAKVLPHFLELKHFSFQESKTQLQAKTLIHWEEPPSLL